MRKPFAVLVVLAAFLASNVIAGGNTIAGKKKPAAHASPKPAVVTEVSPLPGICDTADVLDLIGDFDGPSKKQDQIALVQGRIVECARQINRALEYVPSPTPTPYWVAPVPSQKSAPLDHPVCQSPGPATTATKPYVLYATLAQCVAYWTYLTALPSPNPTDSPPPHFASRPTFYVFATGSSDATAASVLIRSTVEQLNKAMHAAARTQPARPDLDSLYDTLVVGRGEWTDSSSFTTQCRFDPNTRGALLIQTSVPEVYRFNYLFVIANFSHVSASVELLGCGEYDHDPSVSPLAIFSQQAVTGMAHESAFTLGILSAMSAFFLRAHTTSDVTVNGTTKTATVSTTTVQPPYFSGNELSYFQDQNLNLPAQNPSVGFRVASDRFADALMKRLNFFCGVPQLRQMADEANPVQSPSPPLERRTLLYKAAYEFTNDCSMFGNFLVPK